MSPPSWANRPCGPTRARRCATAVRDWRSCARGRAVLRAFSGRLRYRLDNGEAYKAEALTLMCPLTSQAMQTDTGLEAAALDPHDAAQGFRLGLATLMGRWRQDPAVTTQVCGAGEAWAKGRIPVVLDGEPHRLDSPRQLPFPSARLPGAGAGGLHRPVARGGRVSVRIAQLSDIHFGGEDAAATEAALAHVQREPPDLTLVTGDLTLNGLPAEFRAAATWLKRLPLPRLCTPGNHDTPYWNLPLRAFTPFRRYRRHIGPIRHQLHLGEGVGARMVNTSRGAQPRPDWSKGAIDLQSAQAAVSELAGGAAGSLRLVGCHHPLVEVKGAPVSGAVHRGAAAAQMLAEGGVDLILSGHVHNPFAIALPYGDGHTYAVGAGTLSQRTRGTPPSFNWIEADEAAVEITAWAWTGAALEVLQSWRLPRRT